MAATKFCGTPDVEYARGSQRKAGPLGRVGLPVDFFPGNWAECPFYRSARLRRVQRGVSAQLPSLRRFAVPVLHGVGALSRARCPAVPFHAVRLGRILPYAGVAVGRESGLE